MKKILLSITIFLFALSTPFGLASATEYSTKSIELKEEKLDKKLKKIGYTEDRLATMPTELKQEIIDSGVVKHVSSVKKEYYVDDDGTSHEITNNTDLIMLVS
jgi:N-methylhydantoinase B/oxoprolinase/acetone carboxylase alpha subunit